MRRARSITIYDEPSLSGKELKEGDRLKAEETRLRVEASKLALATLLASKAAIQLPTQERRRSSSLFTALTKIDEVATEAGGSDADTKTTSATPAASS